MSLFKKLRFFLGDGSSPFCSWLWFAHAIVVIYHRSKGSYKCWWRYTSKL